MIAIIIIAINSYDIIIAPPGSGRTAEKVSQQGPSERRASLTRRNPL